MMKPPWENYLGNNPELYAREALKACSLTHPPICERIVVDQLGLELVEVTRSDIVSYVASTGQSNGLEIQRILDTACVWLRRDPGRKPRIYIRWDTWLGRRRLGIFHECGHVCLPWHQQLNYLCKGKHLSPPFTNGSSRRRFSAQQSSSCPGKCSLRMPSVWR